MMQGMKSATWRATLLTTILLAAVVACKQQSGDEGAPDDDRPGESSATGSTGQDEPTSDSEPLLGEGNEDNAIVELPDDPAPPGTEADTTARPRGPRVISDHVAGHPYNRTVTLTRERDTRVLRSGREMNATDRLRTILEYTFVVAPRDAQSQSQRVLIDVRDVQHTVNGERLQDARLPTAGQRLTCEADRDAALTCRSRNGGQQVPWPRWAPLDYNRWMAPNVMRPGARWQRSSNRASGLGFDNDDLDEATLRFEVLSIDPISEPSFIQLNLDAEGRLRWDVLGRERTVPLTGTGSVLYQQDLQLMTRLEFGWQAELQTDGVYNGTAFNWHRRQSVRVRAQTSTPSSPASRTETPRDEPRPGNSLIPNQLLGGQNGGERGAADAAQRPTGNQ